MQEIWMMETCRRNRRTRRTAKHKIVFGVLMLVTTVGFLTWLGIKIITVDTTLNLQSTYQLPDFAKLDGVVETDYGEVAVAVDGEIVTEKHSSENGEKARPTASTAKMILALAVLQKQPFVIGESGGTITIDQGMYDLYNYYATHNGSNTAVEIGESISEYDALAATMLASSNNMADSLAIWAFGSIDNYREYAIKMLEGWGITDTTIGVDACGFDPSTTSTAADLARIGEKLLENEVLAEIVSTKEYTLPVSGLIKNTNLLLGQKGILGIKTGFIGEASGYCLVIGYRESEHIITVALMAAPTREKTFADSLEIISKMQEKLKETRVIQAGEEVGYYESWWTGKVKIFADNDLSVLGWDGASGETKLEMNEGTGVLKILIAGREYKVGVTAESYNSKPSLGERFAHAFGWSNDYAGKQPTFHEESDSESNIVEPKVEESDTNITTNARSANCTIELGALMLVNPNFTVEDDFIATRGTELVSLSQNYGIKEGVAGNGDNLLDAEAAIHINEMIKAYEAEYPGHTMETRSCFRARGTNCGRLCAATGASDHHTGLTCDLLDPIYGTSLDTSTYDAHIDWQWLRANSYKYGFIDRFPEAWAGGSMDEPLNVDENGSTGLFETWHYRYVGVKNATEIATGKYNDGKYDSLEHYLKARGLVVDLKNGKCN